MARAREGEDKELGVGIGNTTDKYQSRRVKLRLKSQTEVRSTKEKAARRWRTH
jgi:hypothetical protein